MVGCVKKLLFILAVVLIVVPIIGHLTYKPVESKVISSDLIEFNGLYETRLTTGETLKSGDLFIGMNENATITTYENVFGMSKKVIR